MGKGSTSGSHGIFFGGKRSAYDAIFTVTKPFDHFSWIFPLVVEDENEPNFRNLTDARLNVEAHSPLPLSGVLERSHGHECSCPNRSTSSLTLSPLPL